MRKIVYYIASSIDGFITGANEDVSRFIYEGPGVEKYKKDLQEFDTVIMGRKTYEFAYQFGLVPGQPAYPHMKHYIFSSSLSFDNPADNVQAVKPDIEFIKKLKEEQGSDIYLCGGGQFAGWLLDHKLIDVIKIKLNPLVLGEGTPLFGKLNNAYQLSLMESERFDDGLQILSYRPEY